MIRRFNRYELKYVLPVSQCDEIRADLRRHLCPDSHGGERGYRVVSLYYDSADLACFWAKVEGIRFRRKVRLRIYPELDITQTSRGLVEIKQRINRTVQKRRLVLPLAAAEQLCAGKLDESDLDQLDELDASVAHEVTFLVKSMQLKPTAITAYHRQAWVGQFQDAGLRVTFDTSVGCRDFALKVNESTDTPLFISRDWCIMEVKANETVPDWMTSLLARHDCQLRRVSKYCSGLAKIRNFNVLPMVLGPGEGNPLADTPRTEQHATQNHPIRGGSPEHDAERLIRNTNGRATQRA